MFVCFSSLSSRFNETTVTLFSLASPSTRQIVFRIWLTPLLGLIFDIPEFDHILSALSHLHWLSVTYRVHLKLLLLVYKSLKVKAHNTLKNIRCLHLFGKQSHMVFSTERNSFFPILAEMFGIKCITLKVEGCG